MTQRQVVTVSYTAYVKYMSKYAPWQAVDYKTWAKWMATP